MSGDDREGGRIGSALALVGGIASRHRLITLASCVILTVLAVLAASELRVNADLSQLLPRDSARVQGLETLERELGLASYLVVVLEGKPVDELVSQVDLLAISLTELESVSHVEREHPTEFFTQRALLYASLESLEDAYAKLERVKKREAARANPLVVLPSRKRDDASEESLDELALDFDVPYLPASSDEQTLDTLRARVDAPRHFIARDPDRAILLLYPSQKKLDLNKDRAMLEDVESILGEQLTEGTRYRLGGGIAKRVTQQASMQADMKWVSIVGLLLVLIYLTYVFRRPGAVIIVALPLVFGVVWALGAGALLFGELNILTSFVSVMLLGLGLDHGVHLLTTYQSHKGADEPINALEKTYRVAGPGVFLATLTTLIGFGAVSTSDFEAFREFGALAAVGMLAISLAYLTAFPALVMLLERFARDPGASGAKTPGWLTRLTFARPGALFALTILLGGFALTGLNDVGFESSWRRLSGGLPAFSVDDDMREVLGRAQSGIFILTSGADESKAMARELRERAVAFDGKERLDGISQVLTPGDFIPRDQRAKRALISRMKALASELPEERTPSKYKEMRRYLIEDVVNNEITFEDLPLQVRRPFQGESNNFHDRLVLLWSDEDLDDGEKAKRLIEQVDGIAVEGHGPRVALGIQLITADAIALLATEAPRMSLFVFAAIFLVLLIGTRSVKSASICTLAALWAVLVGVGALGLLGVKLNYFNIALVAVIIGMAVDGAIHVTHRAHLEGVRPEVMDEVTRANFAALFTTALGFGAMRLAQHPGVISLADLALIGLMASVLVDVVGLPAVVVLLERFGDGSADEKNHSSSPD